MKSEVEKFLNYFGLFKDWIKEIELIVPLTKEEKELFWIAYKSYYIEENK